MGIRNKHSALVSAYPLSLLANLTTPLVKNWWAERSTASIRERIGKLEKQLTDNERNEPLSEGEDYILRASEALSMLLGLCVSMLAVIVLLILELAPPTVSNHDKNPFLALTLVALIATVLIGIVIFGHFARFRNERSRRDRTLLGTSIERLKNKLAQRTGSVIK